MDSLTIAGIVFVPTFLLLNLAAWLFLRVRPSQTHVQVPPAPLADLPTQDALFRSMSERISALEGRIPVLSEALNSFTAVATRMSALESAMPALQDAYERYGDQVARADKRDTERARKGEKDQARQKSAAEAAAELGFNAVPPQQPPGNVAAPPQTKMPGVLGSGSRGRA